MPRYNRLVRCICTRYKCRRRITLLKDPAEYVVKYRTLADGTMIPHGKGFCIRCGSKLRIDQHRQSKRERRNMRCGCGARIWRHTKGPACRVWAEQQALLEPIPVFSTADYLEVAI